MTNEVDQRLYGGTFFTLLLQARKPRMGVRDHYLGETDGLSDPQILIALIKIAVPDYKTPGMSMMKTFKSSTSRYKSCQGNGGTYMPFSDSVTMRSFDSRIQIDYSSALRAMACFADGYLDVGTSAKKDVWLVKALLDLLDKDDSIDDEQIIFAREDGAATTKSDILAATSLCLQSFILGIWHYVLINRTDNKFGQKTYDAWCPPNKGAERVYVATLGENITREIGILYYEPEPLAAEAETFDEDISDCDDEPEAKSGETTEPGSAQQVINNNPTFFNFNVTGNNNSFYNKVDTVIIKNGG